MRETDYVDELEQLIRKKFATRRVFYEAAGISEDLLDQILTRRTPIGSDIVDEALGRIGYRLHIAPFGGSERQSDASTR
jgi:hypothetical protein